METMYRVRRKAGTFNLMTGAELAAALVAEQPAKRPENDRLPHGCWYCENEECVVREVTVAAKLPDPGDKLPAKLHCPCCQEVLSFQHWLTEVTLLPVQRENEKMPSTN